ncbi:MAG: MCE family protein [Gammaproteobacteria bacterium]|nr:MCE family protein [Gammaproteobacteria bacterium]
MAAKSPAKPVVMRKRSLPSRVSLVWILPLLAIGFAAVMLWQAYVDRGPLILINTDNASGVIAGETKIRRNDVVVGSVEAVRLADDLNSVVLEVRMDPKVAPYIDSDTRFWIVSARINTTEISGLGTLLSGSYVEVDWDNIPGDRRSEFTALTEPPLTKRGTPGMRVILNADEAGYIYVGSPMFHRQIEVGRIERRRLSPDGTQVLFDAFVEAPYHRFIFDETRFFGVSGVEASINADGATVRVESVAALFTGGVAFENADIAVGSEPVLRDGKRFKLYDSRTAARDSLFEDEDDRRFRYIAEFEGSTKGLRRGAPIEYNGLRVGRVTEIKVEAPKEAGDPSRVYAILQFQPRRLGLNNIAPTAMTSMLQAYVDKGVRVQLATGNLLTGSLIVKLVEKPELGPAKIDMESKPFPALPTLPSNVEAVTADVETLVKNLSELPLQSLVEAATMLLRDTQTLVANPDLAKLPTQLSDSLASIANTAERVESATTDLPAIMSALLDASKSADEVLDGLSPDSEIYIELSAAAKEMRLAAKSIARFAELLEDNPNALLTGR